MELKFEDGTYYHVSPKYYDYTGGFTMIEDNDVLNPPDIQVERFKNKFIVSCSHPVDLSSEKILHTLSCMKGRLQIMLADSAYFCRPKFQCTMSNIVLHNMKAAYRRLEMYGKTLPIIARFDEYGRRLPSQISIDTLQGIDICIIHDMIENHYLELTADISDNNWKITDEDEWETIASL